jgi:hypothetical protein
VEVIEVWRKLQNGHYILLVINILMVIKSKENSTVGICSMRGRNVKKEIINIYGWNPWNVEKEEINERSSSTKSVGFLKYSRNPQSSKKGSVLWTAVHHTEQTAVFRRPVFPLPRFKSFLISTTHCGFVFCSPLAEL